MYQVFSFQKTIKRKKRIHSLTCFLYSSPLCLLKTVMSLVLPVTDILETTTFFVGASLEATADLRRNLEDGKNRRDIFGWMLHVYFTFIKQVDQMYKQDEELFLSRENKIQWGDWDDKRARIKDIRSILQCVWIVCTCDMVLYGYMDVPSGLYFL